MPPDRTPRRRGAPRFYSHPKVRVWLYLTPTAIDIIDVEARSQGVSRSEYVERLVRKLHSDRLNDSARTTEDGSSIN